MPTPMLQVSNAARSVKSTLVEALAADGGLHRTSAGLANRGRRRWVSVGKRCIAAAVGVLAFVESSAQEPSQEACRGLARLLSAPTEFQQRSAAWYPDSRSTTKAPGCIDAPNRAGGGACIEEAGLAVIPNIDLDGDGRFDVMYFRCPGSASIRKPDPCEAEVHFGGGPKIRLPDYYPIILYQGIYYAIDAEVGLSRVTGKGTAYQVTRAGLKLACSKL